VAEALAQDRFQAILFGVFGGVAVLLAGVGIYGVMAYAVSLRTREFGLRVALGAHAVQLQGMVVRRGLRLAAIGIVLGISAGVALTGRLRELLFEIQPTDPATFIAVPLALLVIAVAACYLPARRATRVNPIVALRHE
jgi:ABC-type antimicrobial peptide transport system permease subunit